MQPDWKKKKINGKLSVGGGIDLIAQSDGRLEGELISGRKESRDTQGKNLAAFLFDSTSVWPPPSSHFFLPLLVLLLLLITLLFILLLVIRIPIFPFLLFVLPSRLLLSLLLWG